MIALTTSSRTRPEAVLSLRRLVARAALLTLTALAPTWAVCLALGRLDIARGFVAGVLLGVLNSMLLAQRLDRMISGAEGVESLRRVFEVNRALRIVIVLGGALVATQVRGLHMAALVAGLGFFFVLSGVLYSRSVLRAWRSEEEWQA